MNKFTKTESTVMENRNREIAKLLRGLVRRADNFGKTRQDVLEEIIWFCENLENVAEHEEMQEIVQLQRDWAANN
jgi:hypothetical protein